jgi:hypothetical protein
VPAVALWLLVVTNWQWRCACNAAVAGAVVIGFAGLLDAWSWGTAFISYYNNLNSTCCWANSDAFGRSPPFAYLSWLIAVGSAGVHLLAVGYGAVFQWRRCWPILLLLACVFVPHSLIGHKEYRFVILAVPLLLVLLADAIVNGCSSACAPFWRSDAAVGARSPLVAALSAAGCIRRGVFARNDRLVATLDLSRRTRRRSRARPDWPSGRARAASTSFTTTCPSIFSNRSTAYR